MDQRRDLKSERRELDMDLSYSSKLIERFNHREEEYERIFKTNDERKNGKKFH